MGAHHSRVTEAVFAAITTSPSGQVIESIVSVKVPALALVLVKVIPPLASVVPVAIEVTPSERATVPVTVAPAIGSPSEPTTVPVKVARHLWVPGYMGPVGKMVNVSPGRWSARHRHDA